MTDPRFAKINVRVRDLDAALAYMRDTLGAEVLRERNTNPFGEMVLVRYGGLTIEILAPDRPDSSLARIIERRGEGIDSIGFYTDDLNGTVAALESNGATMASNDGHLAWLHPKNPLSLSIELVDAAAYPPTA
jgi:methylmalonyl-CoA/ethylmalonyl-CoA epimerase